MTVVSAFVLWVIIWFLTLFVVLPIGLTTQAEKGEVVPGTPASAPVEARIRRKMLWVTAVTLAIWGSICAFILWSGVTIEDIDFFHLM